MTPNELLLWLSARREGSWQQFRGAVQSLDLASDNDDTEGTSLPLHQRVRFSLERLAHAEFDAAECENGWRVVPPSLALSQHERGATAVLCGARTRMLTNRIETAATGGLSLERIPQPDCPDVIRVHASSSEQLMALAAEQNLLCAPDAPSALLSHIPPIDSFMGWRREPMPTSGKDWTVRQFVIQKKVIKWLPVTLREANASRAQGLFCFTLYQRPRYFLREGHISMILPSAIGKYRILSRHRRRILKYDRRERLLTLPAILRPPLLTERALILCSGLPPALTLALNGRPMLTYRGVPEEIAGMAAELLRQDFA